MTPARPATHTGRLHTAGRRLHPDFLQIKATPFSSKLSLRRHDGTIWRATMREAIDAVGAFSVNFAILNGGRWHYVLQHDAP